MKVTTDELRQAANALLDYLDETGRSEFTIEEDYYWNVPQEEVYKPFETPTELDMGQLSDDLAEIRKLNSKEAPLIGYGLVWLAALLRRVGEKAVH